MRNKVSWKNLLQRNPHIPSLDFLENLFSSKFLFEELGEMIFTSKHGETPLYFGLEKWFPIVSFTLLLFIQIQIQWESLSEKNGERPWGIIHP